MFFIFVQLYKVEKNVRVHSNIYLLMTKNLNFCIFHNLSDNFYMWVHLFYSPSSVSQGLKILLKNWQMKIIFAYFDITRTVV
jgi:hypothetical protein